MMTAFEQAWDVVKAEQEFITGTESPEEIARLRYWLYNDEWPEDEEGQKRAIEKYGTFDSVGQASTYYGYKQKANPWMSQTFDYGPVRNKRRTINDRTKPIFGEGRTLLGLDNIYEGEKWKVDAEYDARPDAPIRWYSEHPDYQDTLGIENFDERMAAHRNNRAIKYRLDRERDSLNRNRPEPSDEDLIARIIEVINHEVAHTTQPEEEREWQQQYTAKDAPYALPDPPWSEETPRSNSWRNKFIRNVLMQESLATIMENPHETNWRKPLAQYKSLGLDDHHDLMREVSANMVRFFNENPDLYRDSKEVARHKAEIDELLADVRGRTNDSI